MEIKNTTISRITGLNVKAIAIAKAIAYQGYVYGTLEIFVEFEISVCRLYQY